ncbi:uncharacterized protein NEMAJ01_1793 [Nematocida major]|uniref:uncharacterized protein n=1 Tax=Nematocida major TaxID=1912982 RepID=UPI0020079EDB|nr:uncharacterized protein NEMAJ01_1793 [Nematocida major]KAH9386897.1 hypothetical protein NEMAJ01_1793 [Nematocida major]
MKRRMLLLSARVLLVPLLRVQAFYNDNTSRCQLYGISYADCLGSVYRPASAYDSYIKSFNLPIHKDDACLYSICKMALMNTGSERYISIAQNAHPSGECICLGAASCGCEVAAVPAPEIKTVFALPTYRIPEPEKIMVTRTVSKTKTITVKVTETPSYVEGDQTLVESFDVPVERYISGKTHPTPGEMLLELTKKLDMLNSKGGLTSTEMPHPSPILPPMRENLVQPPMHFPDLHPNGNVITIPYSTVTTTVQKTVPVYSTTVRTQYVVNTVDNYITETITKTQVKTETKTKTATETKTLTETISDHVERTKFSTVYVPKTTTIDKVSTYTMEVPKTVTSSVTKTITQSVAPTKEVIIPSARPIKIKKRVPIVLQTNSSPSAPQKSKYFIVKKEIKNKMVCKGGCTNPSTVLSGECPIDAAGSCMLAQQPGFRPATPVNKLAPECKDVPCIDTVKTVYVNAIPTPAPAYTA